ncbi:hypothetical protein BDP27DRAFT_1328984, partial [Rhodocollybia butyracea]
ELLHPIVEYIAYKPRLPYERFRRVSSELRSLSVVDHRLRRICLPFLFANICIRTKTDAERLQDFCSISPLCSNFTKVLKLGRSSFRRPETAEAMMKSLLPSLTRLSTVDLEEFDNSNINFLKAILEHSSVSSVLVGRPEKRLLDSSILLDMSKFVLSAENFQPTLETWLAQGTRLLSLNVYGPKQLDEEFGLKKFEGLEVLNLFVDLCLVSFSWLPRFSSSHPCLHQLWLTDVLRKGLPDLSFIRSLVEESREQNFSEDYRIKRVGLGRATSRGILTLITSSFPALEVSELDLSVHDSGCSTNEVLSALAHFSSLRTLSLSHDFGRLFFGCNDICQPIHLVNEYDTIQMLTRYAEAAVLAYISRLARSLTGLESCFIFDYGQADGDGIGERWVQYSRFIDSEELQVYAGGNLISQHK